MRIQTKRRYSSFFLECLELVGWNFTVPWKYAFDLFVSCFIPVTAELKQPWALFVTFLLYLPIYAAASFLSFPLAVVGFCMIIPIRSKRLPYLYSYNPDTTMCDKTKKRYCIGTANLCLLPDYMSRINNLHNTYQRTTQISEKILQDQFATRCSNSQGGTNFSSGIQYEVKPPLFQRNPHIAPSGTKVEGVTKDFSAHVLEKFPQMDFLLLQETWYKTLSKKLAKDLHKEFPWIVYDASYDSAESNCHGHNSGLMIASRFEIEEVEFNWFRDFCNYCRFNSKGLLQIKVHLGEEGGIQKVGYLATTHMQVFQGNEPIHVKQLDSINIWLDAFRKRTLKSSEQVAFDVMGGDFNFDNISPVDERATNHEIFTKYIDIGRKGPGQDYYWAVGTECRPKLLHDKLVSTPHGLKLALEDPILLQNYVMNADWTSATLALVNSLPERDSDGNIIPSPVGGRRRIDFLLFRKEDHVLISGYNPVSSLAALTDHIPLCLTLQTK